MATIAVSQMALEALLSHSWRFLLLWQHLDLIWEERSCLGGLWANMAIIHSALLHSTSVPLGGVSGVVHHFPIVVKDYLSQGFYFVHWGFFFLKMKNSLSKILKLSDEREGEMGWFLLAGLAGTGWWGAVTQLPVLLWQSLEISPPSPNSCFIRIQGLS